MSAYFWYQSNYDPGFHFLNESQNASWIRDDVLFETDAKPFEKKITLFRKQFKVDQPVQSALLKVKAFKFFKAFLNNKLVYESTTKPSDWKNEYSIDIGPVSATNNELVIVVMNFNGPRALSAYSDALSLKTDSSWQFSNTGKVWSNAALIREHRFSQISSKFPAAHIEFINSIPIGILAIILVFLLKILAQHNIKHIQLNSSTLRWFLIGLLFVMAVNNLMVTKPMGFDMRYHVEYIMYILERGMLPIATDGIQMFQSPLYYIISELFMSFSLKFFDLMTSYQLLKLVPLSCGVAMVEICYRCAKLAFPDRDDIQSIALLTGSILPMNLYMSQYLGNEPLHGLLTAASILVILNWVRNPGLISNVKQQIILGTLLGLAVLTKVTAIIISVILLTTMIFLLYRNKFTTKHAVFAVTRVTSVILLIAGWYYLRNWIILGKPFVGGWDPSTGMSWWQDPGYNTANDFLTFGQALVYPIHSATHGFWNSIYTTLWADGLLGGVGGYESRPPWNYTFVISTVWLSILPTAGLLSALFFPIRQHTPDLKTIYIIILCNLCILTYLLAIFSMYFQISIYGSAKASYSLGLLPCFGILIAFGLTPLLRNRHIKLVITICLAWWGINSYLGYFPVA